MKTILRLAATAALIPFLFVSAAKADGVAGAPAPFDKGGVKLALISYISAGDFFQAYQAGAEAQAKALGIDLAGLPRPPERGRTRASRFLQAINLGVEGIVVDHGVPESLGDVVQQALDKGIKVVAFDVNLNNPKVPQVEQSDHALAKTGAGAGRQGQWHQLQCRLRLCPAVLRRSIAATRSGTRSRRKTRVSSKRRASAMSATRRQPARPTQAKAALRANPDITRGFCAL